MKFKILICSLILGCSFIQTFAYNFPKLQYENIYISKYKTELTFKDYSELFSNKKELIEIKTVNFTETNEILYATTNVNIRVEPNKNSEKIGYLKKSQEIKRIGIGDNGWSKVIYNNQECYINSTYLSKEKPIEIIEEKEEIIDNQEQIKVIEPIKNTNNIIQKEGNIKDSYLVLAENYFDKLPKNLQTYLINNNIKIYITDTNLANRFYEGIYSSIMGVTVYADKTIYIEDRNSAIKEAIIHEIGHIIDNLNGTLSSSEEFQNIYNLEKNSFVEIERNNDHCISSSIEYFAEVVNQAILYPDSCKSSAPRSYEYIMNIINNL